MVAILSPLWIVLALGIYATGGRPIFYRQERSGYRGQRFPLFKFRTMTMSAEEALLRKMGVELQAPDAGCCGMAGAFGFEREKFDISKAIGERVLLPAVRQAAPETLIASDGFSCREQIAQLTGRRALHLAEILKMAATP